MSSYPKRLGRLLAGVSAWTMCAGAALVPGSSPFAASDYSPEVWRQAVAAARQFVARETPPGALPFTPGRPGDSRRLVLADYTPALPVSFDNQPADRDSYARRLPTGTEPDSALIGRYGVWQRPLPAGPFPGGTAYPTYAAIDVFRAARIGIDGFVIDLVGVGDGNRNWEATKLLIAAAGASGTGLRIAAEPDMNALKDATLADVADALSYISDQPAALHLPNGHLLVIPYNLDLRPLPFWVDLRAEMTRRGKPIDIIAQSLNLKAAQTYAPVSVGLSFWDGRDPDSSVAQVATARAASQATGLPMMLPIAPQDVRPKPRQFWEARNTEAFRDQWQAAIATRVPGVHLITWNDYTEGSAIARSSTTQFLFYDLTAYYAAWYKQGVPPPISRDALLYSFRRQIFAPGADASGAAYGKRGATPLANDIELIGFLRSPGRLSISTGGHTTQASVGAGLQSLRVPAAPGTPCFALSRGGATVVPLAAATAIEADPRFKDATYGGGSSLRPYVATTALPPGATATARAATPPGAAMCR